LYINGNQLEQLPEEIGNLVALEKFDISNNKLKRLPASVGKLKKLEELNLSGNVIAEGLPVEIGELDYLIVMNLNACGLAELPKEFCNLDRSATRLQ
jgi:Leucine-rich repeat (LRR) protein